MFKIKHLMDAAQKNDGGRLWVEPIGLTKDLVEWCSVSHIVSEIGPPMALWDWFEENPDGYEVFRTQYHKYLSEGSYRDALIELAQAATKQHFTLLHQSSDREHNTATALMEYLSELSARCRPHEE